MMWLITEGAILWMLNLWLDAATDVRKDYIAWKVTR